MLENIKLIIGLTDDSQDQLILLYIDKITNMVLGYCNIDALNMALESFVEDKVASIIQTKGSAGNTSSTGAVKAVTRGDTRIEYNVISSIGGSGTADLTDSDKSFLNRFRKAVMF